jgi:hypothetical protein
MHENAERKNEIVKKQGKTEEEKGRKKITIMALK